MNWEHVDRDTKVYVSFRHLDVFNPSKSIWSAQILYMEQNGPETEMAQPRPAASAADRRTALFETNCAPVRRTASLGRASWATNDVLMDRFYDILPKTMCSYCMYCLFCISKSSFQKFAKKVANCEALPASPKDTFLSTMRPSLSTTPIQPAA